MSRWSFWSENCHCFWNAQTCSAILSGSLATDSKEVLCADKSVILTFYVTSVVLTFCDSNFFTNHTGLCLAAEWIRTAVLLEVLGDKFHHVHPWLLLILVCFGDCIVWICLDMFGLWIVSVSSLFSLIHRPEWRVWTNTIGYNGMQGEWYIKWVLWGGCGQIRWAFGRWQCLMDLPSFPWEGVHKYDGHGEV